MSSFKLLDSVEAAGNKLPHPAVLFIYLCAVLLVCSSVAGAFHWQVVHPVTGATLTAVNLLSVTGLHRILTESVSNFIQFAPVGTVLVAMMGIGIAEHSGLLAVALRALVLKTPTKMLSFMVVLSGVLSSIAMDIGYVVLVPLAAVLFKMAGRHPLLGIAAAFAGVSGGFSANVLIGPLDAILSGISTEAAALVDPSVEVSIASNYYFMVFSTVFISVIGAWVTEKIVARRLTPSQETGQNATITPLEASDIRALKVVGYFSIGFIGLILLGVLPEHGVLRHPETHSVLHSPFIQGIVTLIAIYAALCGIVFGRVSGRYKRSSDFVMGMESSLATMAGYMVLMFFAAQFVNYFAWSNLGSLLAIEGASLLSALKLPSVVLLLVFIVLVAVINVFIGSSSAKWALLAPVFVPMLMLLDIPPAATQVAYRVGDSCTNIISPLMPYFGVVIAFAQKHQKGVGMGTIAALMLPYSMVFLLAWSFVLVVWLSLGLPLGF